MASPPSAPRLRPSPRVILTLVALGAAGAAYRLRRGTRDVVTGTFSNGMGYARIGTGALSLLWIGGPSVGGPGGLYLKMMTRMLRPFVQHGYTVWLMGLKPNLGEGCTIADMAEDYAKLIAEEFAGKVDVVVGDSTGGMIGFYLAAHHPRVFGHIVIAVAAYGMTDEANAVNLASARLLSVGRKTDAAAALVTLMYPGIRPAWVARLLAWAVARVSFAAAFDPRDVLRVAEAINALDAREILPSIRVPVLLVCGDKDRWFANEAYQQTADLIPNCKVKMYKGKDHMGAMFDKRLPLDVLEFVQQPHPGYTRTPTLLEDVRESGRPGGGQGRRDEIGGSGVQPVSIPHAARPEAVIRGMAEWGQGERGAAGYQDHGESELRLVAPAAEIPQVQLTSAQEPLTTGEPEGEGERKTQPAAALPPGLIRDARHPTE